VREDRQDRLGHSSGQHSGARASVREAAELLGTTVDAIRKRVQRGTIPYEKASDGRVWILLGPGQDATGQRQDTDQPQSDSSALISAKDETITALRDQLEGALHLNSPQSSNFSAGRDSAPKLQSVAIASLMFRCISTWGTILVSGRATTGTGGEERWRARNTYASLKRCVQPSLRRGRR